ncbi:MAG: hypothetical protein OQJ81_01545 [Melioribacteraceae bacterium]|nr:hypothetical protein [Melioribacteraceae bacterium]
MKLQFKYIYIFSGLLFFLNICLLAQKDNIIEIGNLYEGEVEYSAFEIIDESTVHIEGKAANFGGKFSENLVFYGWILKSETREVVWDARENFDFETGNGIFSFDEKEPLEKGNYEVYYASQTKSDYEINNFSDLMSKIFSSKKSSKFKQKYREELGITVSGENGKFKVVNFDNVINGVLKNSVASLNHVLDNQDLQAGFSLDNETELRIYTIGEGRKEHIIDLAWITNIKSNRIVWRAALENSSHAGGGLKNYVIDRTIKLPKGSYLLHYSSDDSHSFQEWNVMPPNDPVFWGATIWPASEKDKRNVVPFKAGDIVKPLVELTKVGDNAFLSQGFSLLKPQELRILCLGEGYNKDDLSDFGWIVNADTKEIIWTMNDNRLIEHAGGATKNRMVEETIKLDKGNYIAYYSSDDSHSYEEWNSTNPFDRGRWGITIWSESKDYQYFDADSYKSKNIIAEIVKVTDDENLKQSFTLSRNSKVRIYAIGEGGRSGMDDYGWIENDYGDIVWEMNYRDTEEAGGASKNRLFNGTINLDSGKYTLHFRTDDSHSYQDWNSTPPANQDSYGISLFLEK